MAALAGASPNRLRALYIALALVLIATVLYFSVSLPDGKLGPIGAAHTDEKTGRPIDVGSGDFNADPEQVNGQLPVESLVPAPASGSEVSEDDTPNDKAPVVASDSGDVLGNDSNNETPEEAPKTSDEVPEPEPAEHNDQSATDAQEADVQDSNHESETDTEASDVPAGVSDTDDTSGGQPETTETSPETHDSDNATEDAANDEHASPDASNQDDQALDNDTDADSHDAHDNEEQDHDVPPQAPEPDTDAQPPAPPPPPPPPGPPAPQAPPAPDKVSKLHYLIPASNPNLRFCFNLASSAANRYPVPSILGYHGKGLFDAAATHLAKLRAIERYLNDLEPEEDDDLVIIVDGYDIILQLPPEIMIERYFEVVQDANNRLAKRFGITVKEAREKGLTNTVLWGPDKICFPIDWAEPRCWAIPTSNLPSDAYGPRTGNGEMQYNDPRWLNSGTVIGPIDDVRKLITATMEEINATYSEQFEFKESDQYYISNVWGRQEYFRSLKAVHGAPVEGGPADRRIPTTRTDDQQTDFHIGIDYESALFQTKAGYEPFFGYLKFNTAGLNARMNIDMFEEGDNFVPYDIPMPANVYSALGKLWESMADSHPGVVTNDWIRTIKLGTNYITQHIFPLWHCTGPKDPIFDEYPKMWFFPYARELIKATVRAFRGDELITNHLVDGRKWAPKNRYPEEAAMSDVLGGAWTDLNGGQFVEWHELCGDHASKLFKEEHKPEPKIDGEAS